MSPRVPASHKPVSAARNRSTNTQRRPYRYEKDNGPRSSVGRATHICMRWPWVRSPPRTRRLVGRAWSIAPGSSPGPERGVGSNPAPVTPPWSSGHDTWPSPKRPGFESPRRNLFFRAVYVCVFTFFRLLNAPLYAAPAAGVASRSARKTAASSNAFFIASEYFLTACQDNLSGSGAVVGRT